MDTAVLQRREEVAVAPETAYIVEDTVLGTSWAIICPGPSLSLYKHFECDQGCLIAVNQAILSTIPDWWAMIDEEVLEVVMEKINISFFIDRTTLWIPEKWNERLNYGRIPSIFDRFKQETWKDLDIEMEVGYRWPWKRKTVYTAIALAIKKGAKIIRLYGADMAGEGYFMGGLTNRRTEHGEARWQDERFWLYKIIDLCKQNGIELIREMPK